MPLSITQLLTEHRQEFAPLVPFDPNKDKLILLDFTESNREIDETVWTDTVRFSDYINAQLSKYGARYGIGGYGEERAIYKRSQVFDGSSGDEEPRRLHLGMDIWGKPHTAVTAPMDGMVHSFAFNNQFGDYGATIVLAHRLEEQHFYCLYGHLSLSSLRNLQEGQRIEKGEVFAEFGIPAENGHWPAHLHFQVICDLEGWKGDYPGVCKISEKGHYLSNCPDPDLILDLMRFKMF